jgi:hypothetical protein
MENKLLLTGRLIDEPVFESSKGGRMFARARIEVKARQGTTVVPIILGGEAAEVLAADIEVGDLIRVTVWLHGSEPRKKGRDLTALVLSDSVERVRKRGARA